MILRKRKALLKKKKVIGQLIIRFQPAVTKEPPHVRNDDFFVHRGFLTASAVSRERGEPSTARHAGGEQTMVSKKKISVRNQKLAVERANCLTGNAFTVGRDGPWLSTDWSK